MIREDTEAWIEEEFEDCSTVMEVAYKYAEVRKCVDEMMEQRLRILIETKGSEWKWAIKSLLKKFNRYHLECFALICITKRRTKAL